MVRVGDMWNYYELYYENGKLTKVHRSFQKTDLETADELTVSGSELSAYKENNIVFSQPVDDVVNRLKDTGFDGVKVSKNRVKRIGRTRMECAPFSFKLNSNDLKASDIEL